MADNKTQRTKASVAAFLAAIPDPHRQRGLKANANLLAELGPHRVGGGCLYLPRLEEIDNKVLTRLMRLSDKGNRQVTKRVST